VYIVGVVVASAYISSHKSDWPRVETASYCVQGDCLLFGCDLFALHTKCTE
jgi:hypothetical protein